MGTVCVVWRPSTNKRDNIEAYALQNTFYAYPIDATEETKKDIEARNKKITDDFEFQKYNLEVFEFDLPFKVGNICRISSRCGMTPKRHKTATAGGKRKRTKDDDDSSSSGSSLSDAEEDVETKKRK